MRRIAGGVRTRPGHVSAVLFGRANAVAFSHVSAVLFGHANAVSFSHVSAVLFGHDNAVLFGHASAVLSCHAYTLTVCMPRELILYVSGAAGVLVNNPHKTQ